ncbi:MAG: polysaccharide deacetylase [Deltaproteobacteria bacterium]|nr:MAG: polysaccharide deacetylase [Deltaproteobacteria bacterium]
MAPVCAVSVDLDPLPCYYRIHALGPPPPALRGLILRACAPRFADVFAARGIRATFFVVGEDLDADPAARAVLAELAAAGHELANHSYAHDYALARRPPDVIAADVQRAHDRIGEVAGAEGVVGFRAPGYDVSPALVDVLSRLAYRYDSSVFPAPGYYAAKAVVMAVLAVTGRRSGAVLTDPRALIAPADPYRPDPAAPWRRGAADLVELPVGVTRLARTPAIGTNLLLAPRWLRAAWLRSVLRRPLFNFELHGIDLVDAAADGVPPELVARQPDLRATGARKRRALEEVLDAVAARGVAFRRLRDVAVDL